MKRTLILTGLFAAAATGGWFLRDWTDTKFVVPAWVPGSPALQPEKAPDSSSGRLTPEQEQARFDADLNRQARIEALTAERDARTAERKAMRDEERRKHDERREEKRKEREQRPEKLQQIRERLETDPYPDELAERNDRKSYHRPRPWKDKKEAKPEN